MLDPELLRDESVALEARLAQRGRGLGQLISELRRVDAERRAIIPIVEQARHAKKELGARIGKAKRDGLSTDGLLAEGQQFAATIEIEESRLEKVERTRTAILLKLPNLAHGSVPVGGSEADNVEVPRRPFTSRPRPIGISVQPSA